DAVPQIAGQPSESIRQPVVIAAERRRELPEQRPELRRAEQRLDALEESFHPRPELAQPLVVCEIARRLDCEKEVVGRLFDPVRDRVAPREPVEGRVHLHRVEALGVELEPARRRQSRWIEDAVAPVRVVPARKAYADRARAIRVHTSGVPAATTRERCSRSSGAAPNGSSTSNRSTASPSSRQRSWAAAMSTDRAALREQTASTRPAARWQSESASEPMIRSR